MEAIPLPPPIELPGSFPLPPPVNLLQPEIQLPPWQPVYPPLPASEIPVPQAVPEPGTALPPGLSEPSPDDYTENTLSQDEGEESDDGIQDSEENATDSVTEEGSGKDSESAPANDTPANDTSTDVPAEVPEDLVPELAEVQTVELPIIGVEIPLPRPEILATAATTAGISSVAAVGGTLFATTLFRQLQPILKPIFKAILKKLAKIRKKPPPKTWARQRLSESRRPGS